MSIFWRFCPEDSHTCAERTCLADQHKRCKLAEAAAAVAATAAKPTARTTQPWLDPSDA